MGPADEGRALWSLQVTAALAVELGAFAVLLAGWVATSGRPAGWAQVALLATAAVAMGIQSGAVRGIGLQGTVDDVPDGHSDGRTGRAGRLGT